MLGIPPRLCEVVSRSRLISIDAVHKAELAFACHGGGS